MKKIIFLALILTGLVHQAEAQSKNSKATTIEIKASIYCDHCLQCESCGDRLEKAVFTEKGIKRVDIDEDQKTLSVVYNPSKTSAMQIKQAIASVGFDADEVKADPAAYEKLDDCCKK